MLLCAIWTCAVMWGLEPRAVPWPFQMGTLSALEMTLAPLELPALAVFHMRPIKRTLDYVQFATIALMHWSYLKKRDQYEEGNWR